MTNENPLFMNKASGGDPQPVYSARITRNLFTQLWDEGVLDLTAFKVTQRAAGANFSVDVAAGDAVVTGDDQTDQGNYLLKGTATVNVALDAAPGTNSRYDIIVLQVNDSVAGGAAGQNFLPKMVKGTAAASPTVPATPATSILLATIGPITSGTSSITNSLIADSRTLAGRRCTPGTCEDTFGSVVPNGWLLANGALISRTTYARLFAHISTTYGVGDGSTTFALPDARGRVLVALDNMGGTDAGVITSSNTLGTKMGAETHTLTQAELPATPITIDPPATDVSDATGALSIRLSGAGGGTSSFSPVSVSGVPLVVDIPPFDSGNLGSGDAHNIMQPSITVNRMIRT